VAHTNGKEEWSEAIEKARELLEEGRREMARATEMAKDKGEEAWKSAQRKSKETWDEMKSSGLNAWDDVKDGTEDVWEDAEKYVRKNPARSLGLCLLVGVFIGTLIARDRD